MEKVLRRIAIVFSAGSLGGLTNSLVVWLFGFLGITTAFGVDITPALNPVWLYPRVVWGGLWGFVFLLPILRGSFVARGFVFSIAPTLVQLFVVFPLKAQKGMMGLDLGTFTPLFVIVFNAVWGITASGLLSIVRKNRN